MGLFDKLRDTVGSDPNSKRYYDIVLNLLICEKRLTKEHIQTFIKAKYSENCGETVLDKVLAKFATSTEPKRHEIWYELTEKQLENTVSCYTKEEVRSICFAAFQNEIHVQFQEVYAVVQQNATPRILEQGIKKLTADLPNWDYPYVTIAYQVIGEEICHLLFAGDSFIQGIAADAALSHLKYTYEEHKSEYITHLYAFVLHALQYEKANQQNAYVSLTKEDCDTAVAQSSYYQKQAAQNPFNKDAVLKNAAEWILKREPILAPSKFEWEHWAIKNEKFVDAACHLALSAIREGYEDPATDTEAAVLIVNHYLTNSEE